jgi:hypothetical protein
MASSAELRLPTLAVPVRLALVGRAPSGAELFVADVARRGRSHLFDDIAALLDESAGFVPARIDGEVRLVAKHAIAWIAMARTSGADERRGTPPPDDDEELSDADALYDRQHHVAIELAGAAGAAGAAGIEGLLLESAPANRPRVVDHLNGPGAFLRLWSSDEHVLVNKQQIVSVTELPSTEPS